MSRFEQAAPLASLSAHVGVSSIGGSGGTGGSGGGGSRQGRGPPSTGWGQTSQPTPPLPKCARQFSRIRPILFRFHPPMHGSSGGKVAAFSTTGSEWAWVRSGVSPPPYVSRTTTTHTLKAPRAVKGEWRLAATSAALPLAPGQWGWRNIAGYGSRRPSREPLPGGVTGRRRLCQPFGWQGQWTSPMGGSRWGRTTTTPSQRCGATGVALGGGWARRWRHRG